MDRDRPGRSTEAPEEAARIYFVEHMGGSEHVYRLTRPELHQWLRRSYNEPNDTATERPTGSASMFRLTGEHYRQLQPYLPSDAVVEHHEDGTYSWFPFARRDDGAYDVVSPTTEGSGDAAAQLTVLVERYDSSLTDVGTALSDLFLRLGPPPEEDFYETTKGNRDDV